METDDEREYQEYLESISEYEKQLQEEKKWEEEYDELNTGINAIDMSYYIDKRVEALIGAFDKAIDYIAKHTDLTEDEIKNCINENIFQIELKEGYPGHPTGVGYVDNIFNIFSVNINVLKEKPEYVEEFIRHEMTHMIGRTIVNSFFKRQPILISGYSRENAFDVEKRKKTENEYFNEATVEMFVAQDEEYREEKVLDFTINTNQDLNGGVYCLNSNLIHQMLIARGIDEQDFFKGLYDFKASKKMIGKFKSTFKKLSSNMDEIFKELNDYYKIDDEIYEMQKENSEADVSGQEKKMDEHKQKLESIVSTSERMIIDKILLPRLKKINTSERQALLSEYDKFIISEREYFKQKTNYKSVVVAKKQEKSWLQHVDVEPLEVKPTESEKVAKRDEKAKGEE